MIHCKNCIHWVDESLDRIDADPGKDPHLFSGCRMLGFVPNQTALPGCKHYIASENLFAICATCGIVAPKVCISLGECANCTDTDLFCVDQCLGGDSRKFCTHFIRLHTEGIQLVDNDQVFDLFPAIGMPGRENPHPEEEKTGNAGVPAAAPKPRR